MRTFEAKAKSAFFEVFKNAGNTQEFLIGLAEVTADICKVEKKGHQVFVDLLNQYSIPCEAGISPGTDCNFFYKIRKLDDNAINCPYSSTKLLIRDNPIPVGLKYDASLKKREFINDEMMEYYTTHNVEDLIANILGARRNPITNHPEVALLLHFNSPGKIPLTEYGEYYSILKIFRNIIQENFSNELIHWLHSPQLEMSITSPYKTVVCRIDRNGMLMDHSLDEQKALMKFCHGDFRPYLHKNQIPDEILNRLKFEFRLQPQYTHKKQRYFNRSFNGKFLVVGKTHIYYISYIAQRDFNDTRLSISKEPRKNLSSIEKRFLDYDEKLWRKLALVFYGYENKEIASIFSLPDTTLGNHLGAAYKDFCVSDPRPSERNKVRRRFHEKAENSQLIKMILNYKFMEFTQEDAIRIQGIS